MYNGGMTLAPNQLKKLVFQQGEVVLGHMRVTELDFPWVLCAFTPTEAFEPLRPLFEAQLRLSEGENWDAYEQVEAEIIALALELRDPETGERISDFLIHFEGDTAWFRY